MLTSTGAGWALTVPVVIYSAIPFYRATWRDLKTRRAGMDTPVTIGIIAMDLFVWRPV